MGKPEEPRCELPCVLLKGIQSSFVLQQFKPLNSLWSVLGGIDCSNINQYSETINGHAAQYATFLENTHHSLQHVPQDRQSRLDLKHN